MKIEKNNPHTLFLVKHEWVTKNLSDEAPDDGYSRSGTKTEHTISGLQVCEDISFNCSGAFELNQIDSYPVYLVYSIYSTGDSFGNDEGRGIEFVEVFKTLEKAERCVKQIELNNHLYQLTKNSFRVNPKEIESLMKEVYNCPKLDESGKLPSHTLQDVFYQNERDEMVRFNSPWHGYFESLDGVFLNTFTVKPVPITKNKNKP